MRKFFRQLSLPKKLILIGVVPLVFLTYIAFELYQEKSQKVALLQLYIQRIYQSANLAKLIDALQNERKVSFDRSINRQLGQGLLIQRRQTDSLLALLKKDHDLSLLRFEEYTFLDGLGNTRSNIDQKKSTSAQIMDTYTNMIFRLNTLNTSFPATRIYLRPVSQDLSALRLLTEMQTYLGIIRSNFFNVLHSRTYVTETLVGTYGVQKVYHSYEKEFSIKAPPEVDRMYKYIRQNSKLRPTLDYIDTVFRHFRFDSTYTADTWWKESDEGINTLRSLQARLWQMTKGKISKILQEEQNAKNNTLIFLIVALIAVTVIISYIIHIITSVLNELKDAAGKIAEGDADVKIDVSSDDAIGSLAASVKQMEKQVRERTMALRQSNANLEKSNKELEQFAYVASHDLQEPIRKIRTFADQLKVSAYDKLDENGKKYLDKITVSSERMKKMINDILDYSQLGRDEEEMQQTDLNIILANVISDLELLISQKNAVVRADKLPSMEGIPIQLNQLFYNLLNNALKFSRDEVPPAISITTAKPSKTELSTLPGFQKNREYFTLIVSDNGIGFNQEYAKKIFDMFQRLTAERTGTGIGLALCKKIVENHKGNIEARSETAKGTTFRIILPIRQG